MAGVRPEKRIGSRFTGGGSQSPTRGSLGSGGARVPRPTMGWAMRCGMRGRAGAHSIGGVPSKWRGVQGLGGGAASASRHLRRSWIRGPTHSSETCLGPSFEEAAANLAEWAARAPWWLLVYDAAAVMRAWRANAHSGEQRTATGPPGGQVRLWRQHACRDGYRAMRAHKAMSTKAIQRTTSVDERCLLRRICCEYLVSSLCNAAARTGAPSYAGSCPLPCTRSVGASGPLCLMSCAMVVAPSAA